MAITVGTWWSVYLVSSEERNCLPKELKGHTRPVACVG